MTDDQAASRLFGGAPSADAAAMTEPPATPNPATQEAVDATLGAKLYDSPDEASELQDVPDEVKELRALPDRKMFDAQIALREVIPDTAFAVEGVDPAVASVAVREVRELAADLDLGPQEIKTLAERSRTLQEADTPVADQVDAAIDALNRRFGTDARQALRDARLLMARDPRTARMIEALGLGNDADTVVLLAERARSQIAAGKLRRK